MTRESTETRKEQIIRAAMDIIASRGLDHLTMQNIGRAVGISDAAIYKHFSGKQEMLLAMIDSIRKNLMAELRSHLNPQAPAPDQIRALLDYHLEYIEKNNGAPHLVFSEALYLGNPRVKDSIRRTMEEYTAFLRKILRAGQEAGEIRADLDIDAFPVVLLGVIQAKVMLWVLADNQAALSANADALWNLIEQRLQ